MRHGMTAMSLSDQAKAMAQSKPTIWREIKARRSTAQAEPEWLTSGPRRNRRRLCSLLIAELLRDQAIANPAGLPRPSRAGP
jgi:hypothetical protein